jgi:hypothetical protein
MNAGGRLNTCKSDGNDITEASVDVMGVEWRTGE